jgi:hypothetical protein
MLLATAQRVAAHTRPKYNERIARKTVANIAKYIGSSHSAIDGRLAKLDREWDIERILEANASGFTLLGLILAITSSWAWLILPLVVASMLLLHALQGWCPPVLLLRRLGVRTETEINQERYALKILRQDFEDLPKPAGDNQMEALELFQAVSR